MAVVGQVQCCPELEIPFVKLGDDQPRRSCLPGRLDELFWVWKVSSARVAALDDVMVAVESARLDDAQPAALHPLLQKMVRGGGAGCARLDIVDVEWLGQRGNVGQNGDGGLAGHVSFSPGVTLVRFSMSGM